MSCTPSNSYPEQQLLTQQVVSRLLASLVFQSMNMGIIYTWTFDGSVQNDIKTFTG